MPEKVNLFHHRVLPLEADLNLNTVVEGKNQAFCFSACFSQHLLSSLIFFVVSQKKEEGVTPWLVAYMLPGTASVSCKVIFLMFCFKNSKLYCGFVKFRASVIL